MSSFDDVPDSTDWLGTPLSGLAPLESTLRCQVCKDFFSTPMITSCSHTFCSLCIRRYLSQEGKCPTCREADQEIKLRRNWTVEELVAQFTQSRDSILKYARQATSTEGRPKKRRRLEALPERRSTRSQSKRVAASQSSSTTILSQEIPDSDEEGSVYNDAVRSPDPPAKKTVPKEPDDGLVGCPSCTRRMKETQINAHLDRCLAGLASPEPKPAASTSQGPLLMTQKTKSPMVISNIDRLPSINYALLTEAKLRQKLSALGIPSHGNKDLMRKRHTEWMNLWNANCDSNQPKPKRTLLRELDTWERTLGKQFDQTRAKVPNEIMSKSFDRDGWVKNHGDEFDDLIQKARLKAKAAKEASKQQADLPMNGVTTQTVPKTNNVINCELDSAANGNGVHENAQNVGAEQMMVDSAAGIALKSPMPKQHVQVVAAQSDSAAIDLTSSPVRPQ